MTKPTWPTISVKHDGRSDGWLLLHFSKDGADLTTVKGICRDCDTAAKLLHLTWHFPLNGGLVESYGRAYGALAFCCFPRYRSGSFAHANVADIIGCDTRLRRRACGRLRRKQCAYVTMWSSHRPRYFIRN